MSSEIVPHVVYHCAAMGDYQPIVREQMLALRTSGLAGALLLANDQVAITHVGRDPHWVLEEAGRQDVPARLVREDGNTDHYETFAFFEIERLARSAQDERPILYFHTKGVSNQGDPGKAKWRAVMNYHVIEHWRERVRDMASCDAAGFNWWTGDHPQFSGNFWVANQKWIRQLPDFASYHNSQGRVRFSCETWLGSRPGCNAHSLGCNNGRFWDNGYDWTPWMPPATPAGDTITWVCAATPAYRHDLLYCQHSADRLGPAHRFIGVYLDDAGPWLHSRKLGVLLDLVERVETSHIAWVDADCEFLTMLPPSDFIGEDKALFAARHICYGSTSPHMPRSLLDKMRLEGYSYHQACLFGGSLAAVRDLVREAQALLGPDGGYDEHALNVVWSRLGGDVLHTLPCRYNFPPTFRGLPGVEAECRSRLGGAARVLHVNRENNR